MTDLLDRFRHIAIEGPIGVGKSSLARRLGKHLGAELLLEKAEENPFLERFYRDPRAHAFQTQLFFLFQRVKQMRDISQPGMFSRGIVSDFIFDKDALFARMNLDDEEYRLYTQIHAQMAQALPRPGLVIWLQASPSTLSERIRQRGIPMEQGVELDYLSRLCDAYVELFRAQEDTPVLTVLTDRFNPAGRDEDFARLLAHLENLPGQRGVFDPSVP